MKTHFIHNIQYEEEEEVGGKEEFNVYSNGRKKTRTNLRRSPTQGGEGAGFECVRKHEREEE